MPNTTRQLFAESTGFIVAGVLSVIIIFFIFGRSILSGEISLQLYDTYFVITFWQFFMPVFLGMSFLVYFIMNFWHGFASRFSNIISVVSGTLIVLFILFLLTTNWGFSSEGWNILPPMSAMSPEQLLKIYLAMGVKDFYFELIGVAILISAMIFYAVVRWRRA